LSVIIEATETHECWCLERGFFEEPHTGHAIQRIASQKIAYVFPNIFIIAKIRQNPCSKSACHRQIALLAPIIQSQRLGNDGTSFADVAHENFLTDIFIMDMNQIGPEDMTMRRSTFLIRSQLRRMIP
jgi:hypothetical protein